MKIDVVVANPPYNNDAYLSFVEFGHQLAQECSLFITPAKWQAKGGEKNEEFRKNIVPHMSKIVFYPDCQDVFDIAETGGISYYYIDKNIHQRKEITNRCKDIEAFNSVQEREFKYDLNNLANIILGRISYRSLMIYDNDRSKRYKYIVTKLMNGGVIANNMLVLNPPKLIDDLDKSFTEDTNYKCRFSSDVKEETESFISYVNTKTVRFFVLLGLTGNYVINNETWRFVPDPGDFDHIFTDEELYKKYNLTEEEINIIESVIKERKVKNSLQ